MTTFTGSTYDGVSPRTANFGGESDYESKLKADPEIVPPHPSCWRPMGPLDDGDGPNPFRGRVWDWYAV